jgi:methylmalonyl-CoA mutase N-terminal domain/subunit
MPPLVTAVEANATLGEIVSRLKGVYGEHRPAT